MLLTGKFIAPEEVAWLIQMDNAWLAAVAEERSAKREREKAKTDN